MAGSFTDFLENKLLGYLFGLTTYTPPATLYLALSTTAINDAGGNITEPVGNGYARLAITNNTTNFPAPSSGTVSNGTALTFAQATGAGWGTIVDGAYYDAPTGGNQLIHGSFGTAKTIDNMDVLIIGIGQFTCSLD